jgi:hypothetical protein
VGGDDVLMPLSLPARLPRWLHSRPFLLVGALRWWNIHQRHRFLLPASVVLLIITGGLLTLPIVGYALEIAATYPIAPFVALAAVCAIATTRRRAHIHTSLVDSWLAPLGAPPSIALRVLLAPLVQVFLWLLVIAIPFLTGSLRLTGAVALWSVVGAAYGVGFIVGWLSRPRHDAAVSGRDFHYVEVRRPRTNWAQAPALEPLSYWAVGQARVFAKPKTTARALLFVLLAIPMGTRGEKVVAIAAGVWVLLYMTSLLIAAIRIAFKATRWLAPTTLRYARFTTVLGYRVVLAQLWIWAWVVFLTYAAALPGALRLSLPLATFCFLSSCAVIALASWFAMRSSGMRSP